MPRRIAGCCLAIALAAGPLPAQEAPGGHVFIELNALESVAQSCRISFLVRNDTALDIAQAVYEAVLFDNQGRVDRLTLFDFGTLPAARPRVRQFEVPGLACASLGRLLINGAATCAGDGIDPAVCTRDLELGSLTDVEVLG